MSVDIYSPPAVPDMEKSIIGLLTFEAAEALEQTRSLKPQMFSVELNQRVFTAARRMEAEGLGIDAQTIEHYLIAHGLITTADLPELRDLGMGIPRGFDISTQVEIVRETWRKREVGRLGLKYRGLAYDPAGPSAAELLSCNQADIFDVMQEHCFDENPLVRAYTSRVLDRVLDSDLSSFQGCSFGHTKLDEFTSGMKPSEVTVVGGRSGVGKTILMAQAARAACKQGQPVDLFSLEMTKEQLLKRIWALEAGVSYRDLMRGWMNRTSKDLIRSAAMRVGEWPLRIHDNGEIGLTQISALARSSARRNGMKWFAVDYAQIVNSEGKDDRSRVANVSRTLTRLAKSEGVHLMLLSQLSKVDHEQYKKPPSVRDLADTRQLENDAHNIILIHREWSEDDNRCSTEGSFIMPKMRNENTGSVPMHVNTSILAFE